MHGIENHKNGLFGDRINEAGLQVASTQTINEELPVGSCIIVYRDRDNVEADTAQQSHHLQIEQTITFELCFISQFKCNGLHDSFEIL